MKVVFYSMLVFLGLSMSSCGDNDIDYQYQAMVMAPNAEDKKVGDDIHLHIVFESLTGEEIKNIEVKIVNDSDPSLVIYQHTESPNVTERFEHHADVVLDATTGVEAHTDWILTATVWSEDKEDSRESEMSSSVQFHVHPQ